MRDSWLQSYGLLKNIYLEPAANSTSRLLQLDSVFPPGSFVHQDSEKYNITPCPALIPGDHQVIAFLAPCLVGFTFDLATDLSHPLKPNQTVVLLVVK